MKEWFLAALLGSCTAPAIVAEQHNDDDCKVSSEPFLSCTPWDHVTSPSVFGPEVGTRYYYAKCNNEETTEEYNAALTDCVQSGGYVK